MDLFSSLAGTVEAEVVSADIPGLLSCFSEKGIVLRTLKPVDPLTVRIVLSRAAFREARQLAQKRGASFKLLNRQGLYWRLKQLRSRPVLLCGILLLAILSLWLPTRVLFIQVEGNTEIPYGEILEKAEICGIRFGASRREVRSEKMKNSLLETLPDLEWAGINTNGCVAVISVRERDASENEGGSGGVSSLVAVRDGIVESCTVTSGNPLCKAGQAVKAGQVLISGYTDCGISIRAQRAAGEIFAKTIRTVTAVAPVNYTQKGEKTEVVKKYSLILGKKRINLLKDSGISGITCDKMYTEYRLTLPGGFQLPVALAVEQWTIRGESIASVDGFVPKDVAAERTRDYLTDQMISGRILDAVLSERQENNVFWITGSYLCSEMIARERYEEIIENYGKDN